MKKGIIMEQHRKYMIVLTEEGAFYKAVPVKNAELGTEVSFKPMKAKKGLLFSFGGNKMNASLRLLALVSVMLLFVLPFYFVMEKSKTYAYVSIDINPSIELEVTENMLVQSIRPVNDDAELILDKLTNYENKNLDEVIHMIMDKSEETGLINNQKNMLVGVSLKDPDTSILDSLDGYFPEGDSDWKIATFFVPEKIREEAEKTNKSMNEIMAQAIQDKDEVVDTSNSEKMMNDQDKAIINSFYNSKENDHSESTTEDSGETNSSKSNNTSKEQAPITPDISKQRAVPEQHEKKKTSVEKNNANHNKDKKRMKYEKKDKKDPKKHNQNKQKNKSKQRKNNNDPRDKHQNNHRNWDDDEWHHHRDKDEDENDYKEEDYEERGRSGQHYHKNEKHQDREERYGDD
ncbi:MAG: anti-sigma factor domain-containing protein [Bacillota bacterium]|uniref:Anti-sigma factor domain-containing protein n=1 Tax=Virgibacillus salarius TaxID=447199 RepID=A0A941DYK4_9BACI|nr:MULTISPECIES: anti-sigma factor domain-containing protein [Bacillaceae]NAZ10686.1 anti-sigma factor domain-containing protein [Agaribacter marinus]MBR7797977.1 anti-sigma factor domain-containing protein [Virgibacillus salarius]MCC2248362.1 anti-sigma factor domain-containing protein [Virgibacillus sp. AGTR]QRZ16422.1 anti-sigma factor domain-containing protein [Virgibacillus sp. AGTR]WBX80086.1 anti-sigma factor domain-containing protein [Virgibacillus salarius]